MAFEQVKEWMMRFRSMFTNGFMRSISEVTENSSIASDRMMTAIDAWLEMFGGNAPWLKDNPQSLGIPAIVASEIARSVTLEMEVNISGSQMADYISEQFKTIISERTLSTPVPVVALSSSRMSTTTASSRRLCKRTPSIL